MPEGNGGTIQLVDLKALRRIALLRTNGAIRAPHHACSVR